MGTVDVMAYDNKFDHMLPMDRCPQCGKEFMRRCRRDEWGYWSKENGRLKLFCSSKCIKDYEERIWMEKVTEVANSKSFAAYKLTQTEGLDQRTAMQRVGVKSNNSITDLKVNRWKELQWLEDHGWAI